MSTHKNCELGKDGVIYFAGTDVKKTDNGARYVEVVIPFNEDNDNQGHYSRYYEICENPADYITALTNRSVDGSKIGKSYNFSVGKAYGKGGVEMYFRAYIEVQ